MAALLGVLLGTEALLSLAGAHRGPLTMDIGPSTGSYLQGFEESEERPPTTLRWTRSQATAVFPLDGRGGEGALAIRCARFLDQPTRVHVYVSGERVGTLVVQPGGYRIHRLPVTFGRAPLRVDLLSEDPDLGIAVDWIRLEGARWRLPLLSIGPRVITVGLLLVGLIAGFSLPASILAAGALAVAQALWAAHDPFAFAHVSPRIALPAVALTAVCALVLRRYGGGRWVTLIFLTSYVLKGVVLFHPSYFYNDVRNNRRYVEALANGTGSLLERNHAAQVQVGVAYPRIVAGKKYAFPYSPVFFLPFTWLPPEHVVDAIKHVALAATAAGVIVVFAMARLVFGAGAGVVGALLAAFLPIHHHRLLLAMWSTLAGHFLDSLVVLAMMWLALRPNGGRRLAALAGLVQLSFLTYIASLFNLSLFVGIVSVISRKLRSRLTAILIMALGVTIVLLYRDFVVLFVSEILPATLSSPSGTERVGIGEGLGTAFRRIAIFYGYGFPALAVAGLVLARRRADLGVFRVVGAYAASFVVLLFLRGITGGLFKDLKEVEFVAPLVALLAGGSLEALAGRGNEGRLAATLVAVGLIVFGLSKYREYFASYTSLMGTG